MGQSESNQPQYPEPYSSPKNTNFQVSSPFKKRNSLPNNSIRTASQSETSFQGSGAKSTLLGNLLQQADVKVNFALTKEERELQKLQHILELEKQKAEARAKFLTDSINKEKRKSQLKQEFLMNREQNVKQRNNEAMERARQLEAQKQLERIQNINDKHLREAEALRRKEQEKFRIEQERQEYNNSKNLEFEQRIQQYNQSFQNKIQQKDQQLKQKDDLVERLKQQQKLELQHKIGKQSAAKEEMIQSNLEKHRQKLMQDRQAVLDQIDKKDNQLSDHKKKLKVIDEEIRVMGENKQNKIYQTLAQAQENENNMKYKTDEKLNYKFKKSHDLKEQNKANQEYERSQNNAYRQAQEERLRQHNEMLEQKRLEKAEKFDQKIKNIDMLKQQEAQAIAQINRIKIENQIQRDQLKRQISKLQAANGEENF